MSKELKPCPFCGGEASVTREGTRRVSMLVQCDDCGCLVESPDEVGRTKPEHWAWNIRAGEPDSTPSNKADVMADEARKRVSGYTAEKKAELEARGREALRQASAPSGQGGRG